MSMLSSAVLRIGVRSVILLYEVERPTLSNFLDNTLDLQEGQSTYSGRLD